MSTIDHYSPETIEQITQQLQRSVHPGTQVYVLLDHCFDPHLVDKINDHIVWTPLYQDHGGDIEVSPLLCQLETSQPETIATQVELLLKVTAGQPMLSFWLSPREREEIYSHFDHYFEVTILPEKLRYILRYADTRILPNLLSALNNEQKTQFLGPFTQLIYFNREGKMQDQSCAPETAIAQKPLTLDEQQFDQMMDASLPDQLIASLKTEARFMQKLHHPSQAYDWILHICALARADGVNEFADVRAWALFQLDEEVQQ